MCAFLPEMLVSCRVLSTLSSVLGMCIDSGLDVVLMGDLNVKNTIH